MTSPKQEVVEEQHNLRSGSRSPPPKKQSASRSPRRSRSRSPVKRSRSPVKRSRSPVKRSRSPVKRSRSPVKRSRSPVKRSRSPVKKKNSRSRSPRRSPSPRRSRSRSPRRSPKKRSRSDSRDRDRSGSTGGLRKGTIVRVHERGFGFLRPDNSDKDIWFHTSDIQGGLDIRQLRRDDPVTFETKPSTKYPGTEEGIHVKVMIEHANEREMKGRRPSPRRGRRSRSRSRGRRQRSPRRRRRSYSPKRRRSYSPRRRSHSRDRW